MPGILPKRIEEEIVALVGRSPNGASFREILRSLKGVSERTLHRRLDELVNRNELVRIGQARAARYALPPRTPEANTVEAAGALLVDAEIHVPMSDAGSEIRAYVRQPIQARKPVGYNREFLERYQPNQTTYLLRHHREHLHRIGRMEGGERPAGTYARELLGRLLIDLSWASSRLEGNTYTRLETQRLIEFGEAAEGKDQTEAQMILNHKAAIEMLVDGAEEIGFDKYTFFNVHSLLSENLLADPNASGRVRRRIVNISGTTYHPLAIPQQLEEYFGQILAKTNAIENPFEQAFFLMVHLPYLQPFEDVNKRVSRLGANIPLIKQNLCPLSFVDVPEKAYIEGTLGVYELNRAELLRDVFLWAYERSCQRYQVVRNAVAPPDPIRLQYREAIASAVGDVVRGLKEPTRSVVREIASALVPKAEIERFVVLTLEDLARLHQGNLARYRLKLNEYQAWRHLQLHATLSGTVRRRTSDP